MDSPTSFAVPSEIRILTNPPLLLRRHDGTAVRKLIATRHVPDLGRVYETVDADSDAEHVKQVECLRSIMGYTVLGEAGPAA
ncbi:hypothetical protein GCM10009678_81970 [Actinomadura kijaniata]|uniref:Uncharacterized protein n=1 Tax=Actinomadura namibiensis TaxID=182080 RepID=A0A7W3LWW7_ACTNM|nr:hypothetical protein [Actinomadura namibiensis]MBA8955816.1 hypothetical protein [Actinomadura namibiensis]